MKEKRKASRIQILESFSVYLVITDMGPYKIQISDLSEIGIGFQLDDDLEAIEAGQEKAVQLYMNQTLFLPLTIKIVRAFQKDGFWNYGAELLDKNKKGPEALKHFMRVLSCLEGVAEFSAS